MGKGGLDEVPERVAKRLVSEVHSALRRRPVAEAKLAGALRALAPYSAPLRDVLAEALEVLVRRTSFDRELYAGSVRTLVDSGDKRAVAQLQGALASDQAGGLAALSAACFTKAPQLATPLARAASSRHAHVAFAAEIARAARGESRGERLDAVAPKIKESHRIALCVDVFLPLTRGAALPATIGPSLGVLRDAERHLGRWLVLAEVATRAGDASPLVEALARSRTGPTSSRAAWALVSWALDPSRPPPEARPTAELVARLSERPSADRDTAFLFRLASAKAPCARAMLEGLARPLPLATDVAVRAARCLARDYGRADLRDALAELAKNTEQRDDLRGLAAAALWDAGERELSVKCAGELVDSKVLGAQVWGSLVQRAVSQPNGELLDEPRFRRVQWGWVE